MLKDCIVISNGFLLDLIGLSNKLIKLIWESDMRKERFFHVLLNDAEADIDEKEVLEGQIAAEEDLQLGIGQLIGVLFKFHGKHLLKLAFFLFDEVVIKVKKKKIIKK